jgi:formylglycine-generating enzyme required for sulfatase activity
VGPVEYPWGAYYPPKWDDGNYAILENGTDDPKKVGVDGIYGTAPVGSFKPNALGFYDLGGNAAEWVLDEKNQRKLPLVSRGGSWNRGAAHCRAAGRDTDVPGLNYHLGLRPALVLSH